MNFFQKFFYSFTKIKAYRRLAYQPFFGYLVLICLIFSQLAIVGGVLEYNRGINQAVAVFEETPMNFTIVGGQLTISDLDMPYTYQSDDGSVTIIDTTGATDASVLDNYSTAVFVGARGMVFKEGAESGEFSFEALPDLTVSTRLIGTFIKLLKWLVPIILIVAFIITLAIRLFQAFLLAVFASIVSAVLGSKLRFGNIMSMSAYAITLPAAIAILFSYWPLRGLDNIYQYTIFFSIAGVIMFLALRDIAQANKAEPEVLEQPVE